MPSGRESLVTSLEVFARLYYASANGLPRAASGVVSATPATALDQIGPAFAELLVMGDLDPAAVAEFATPDPIGGPAGPLDDHLAPWLAFEAEADREATLGPLPRPFTEWEDLVESPTRCEPVDAGGWRAEKAGCVGSGSTQEVACRELGRRLWVRLSRPD